MEKFYLEEPSIDRKEEAIDYMNEFYKFNSEIHGSGGLESYLDNYEGWLIKLQEDINRAPTEERVPARTYFLIRSSDNRIVGMINIRLALNERLKKYGGHIGYCIRPTERKKGYNKINLYLALKVCHEYGLTKVLLDADKDNPASWKTMEALGGVNIREYFEDEYDYCIMKDYEIDVNESLSNNSTIYEPMIEHNGLRK